MRDTKSQHLARVEELHGFEVAEGEPDVRSWEVISRDGHRLGRVQDLLVESEDRTIRYLEVRLDPQPEEGALDARPTGALDLEKDSIPELDSLADRDGVIGQAAVPGASTPDVPARTIGESLVRDSLLDVENRMTAGEPLGGEQRILIPMERARLEPDRRRVRIE